jgi:hypothetical protein
MRIIAAAALIGGGGLRLHVAEAQAPGVRRTDLQRHDLSIAGREVVLFRGNVKDLRKLDEACPR